MRESFTTNPKILDGFENLSIEILDYNRDLAKNIYNTVKTTWHEFDDLKYDPNNLMVKSLVNSVLDRALNPNIIELSTIQLRVKGMSRVGMAHITRQRSATFNVSSQETQQPEFTPFVRLKNLKGHEEEFEKLVNLSVDLYNKLVEKGVPPQDARYVFPQCVECGDIVWNTTVSQLRNIALLRLCNTSAAAEANLVMRLYITEFIKVLNSDVQSGKIDGLTFEVYLSILQSTECLGGKEKTFKSFATLIGDSGRFKNKMSIPASLKPLYNNLKFNSFDFKKTFFYEEMKSPKYLKLDGEEDVF